MNKDLSPKNPEETRGAREAEHFDRLAAEQGETWWGSNTPAGVERLRRRGRMLAAELHAYTEPSVVELGCGTGAFTQYILEQLPALHLTGIDISERTIALAAERLRAYPNAVFRSGDALHLDAAENSCDAVVGCSILHHLPLRESLQENFRILKPGGLLWFSEPNMMNPEIIIEKNVRFIGKWLQNTPEETAFFRWRMARELHSIGYGSISVKPFDFLHPMIPPPLMTPVTWLGNMLERTPLLKELSGSILITARKDA